jgi:DNA-binding Lrp family transcriptional regulator
VVHARLADTDDVLPLDALSLRIIGALQVDGRASWRRIADVLGEPVRTVARRGAALLEDKTVQVVGLPSHSPTHLLRVQCRPENVRAVARELAHWPESVFVYALSRSAEVLAEVMIPVEQLPGLLLDELPRIDGVLDHSLTPVLEYFRTVAEWQPGLLSEDEQQQLQVAGTPAEQYRPGQVLDAADQAILEALANDGRTPIETIAGLAGVSEPTARRRLDQLIAQGVVRIRAVVEPDLIGLPVESLLWIRCAPDQASAIGASLAASPHVRYAAFVMGDHPVVADVTTPDIGELRDLMTSGLADVDGVESALLLQAFKRGGVLTAAGAFDRSARDRTSS